MKVEFTKEQEKAIIKYLSKRFKGKECSNCAYEAGSHNYPYSKTCSQCEKQSRWRPSKYFMPYIMKELEKIKSNK